MPISGSPQPPRDRLLAIDVRLAAGDIVEMRLSNPDGQILAHSRTVAEGNKAVWFALLGKRRTAAWPTGQYSGRVLLRRGEQVVFDEARAITLQ